MRIVGLLALAIVVAAPAAAQPVVVVGTGRPDLDVGAVQAAVNHGGPVVLRGHFSFDAPPTKPGGATYGRMVTVSKEVALSGQPDERGEMPTIKGGFVPFFVEARGRRFEIQGVRFIRPRRAAIWIYAANGLAIAGCRFEGVEPSVEFGGPGGIAHPVAIAIFAGFNPVPPKAGQEEHAEYNAGTVAILNNDIDVGGTAGDQTLGIAVFGVGRSPDKEVDLYISGNNIKNITERGINVNQIGGRARIERNVIMTGMISGPSNGIQPDAIHAVGSGSYLIEHNAIVSEWAAGAGIRVQGSAWSPEANAIVADNDVTMSAPEGTIFGANSAAIEIRGSAHDNVVRNNRIRGRARAAVAVAGRNGDNPEHTTFLANELQDFQASPRDGQEEKEK